jgi:hypothetical protein
VLDAFGENPTEAEFGLETGDQEPSACEEPPKVDG